MTENYYLGERGGIYSDKKYLKSLKRFENNYTIILTSPHSKCDRLYLLLKEHWCDYIAEEMLDLLNESLNDKSNDTIITRKSDTLRPICDLNRNRCWNTSYRMKLRQLFESINPKKSLLFDIHSYPSNSDYGEFDFVIIIQDKYKYLYDLIKSLVKSLNKQNINVGVLKGGENSIVIEALSYDIPSFLFEFNESYTYNKLIVNEMGRWISILFK